MTHRPIVRRPTPGSEAPRPWTVVAVALVGVATGLWLVWSTLDEGRGREAMAPERAQAGGARKPNREPGPESQVRPAPDPEPPPPGEKAAGPAAEPDREPEPEPPAGEPPKAPEPEPEAEPEAAPEAIEAPEAPDGPAATPAGTGRRVVPGRVAYLRCEGVPLRDGPYPCPRDQALEQAVWAALDELPRCPTAPEGTGSADVRLHFRRGSPPEVLLLEQATDLDGPRLLSCLREPLGALETQLDPDHMVVSFRFRLESE